MDDLLSEFLTETAESLDVVDVELVRFEKEPNDARIVDNIFRLVHTIKGTCGFLGLPRLEALAHAAETVMGRFRDGAPASGEAVSLILASIDRIKDILAGLEAEGREPDGGDDDLIAALEGMATAAGESGGPGRPPRAGEVSAEELERAFDEAEGPKGEERRSGDRRRGDERRDGGVHGQTIRVHVDTLDHLMTMVSELVLTRNQLLGMVRRLDDCEFRAPLQRLSAITAELQEGVMKTRMQPIGNAWQKLPRIVRDLAAELGKKIDLRMHGAETELDRQVLELVRDPLTHMVRNSADHGIEAAAERAARGKPETGVIRLSARHEGGHIIVEVADDGRGLDVEGIRRKARERGIAGAAELEAMTPAQIHKLVFAAGLSTVETVTAVSGRGVGMDVVRTHVELIGGSVDVASAEGRGSTFTIKIPLTLAIVPALVVAAAGQRFAIPQINVAELVRVGAGCGHRIERIDRAAVLRLRNRLLPLVRLGEALGIAGEAGADPAAADEARHFVVVTRAGGLEFGIVVDAVFDTEEIVVKPMSSMLRPIDAFSGNTILGDGGVVLILDPNGIARRVSAEAVAEAEAGACGAGGAAGETEDDEGMAVLLFRAGGRAPKAVPLSLVTRLEHIEVADIEPVDGRELVQYRGRLMPLVRMPGVSEVRTAGRQPVLVFSQGARSMGLAVDEIVDIVSERLEIELADGGPGRIGTAVIGGRATEVIDAGHYVREALGGGPERDAAPRRLLLVDDSPFFRDMLTQVLAAAGYEVTAVASAREAFGLKAKGRRFDVIVSDIDMPEIDGYGFADALRDDAEWGRVPILALSSHATADDLREGRGDGFYDFVGKFDRERLVQRLGDSLADMEHAA